MGGIRTEQTMSDYEMVSTLEDLTKSSMLIELGSFEGDSGTVFSCKIKSYDKWAKTYKEHSKGYSSMSLNAAFTKAYKNLNKLGRYD